MTSLGELFDHFFIKRRDVRGLAAGDETVVHDDVAIYPSALGLGQVQQHYIDSGRTLPGVAVLPNK